MYGGHNIGSDVAVDQRQGCACMIQWHVSGLERIRDSSVVQQTRLWSAYKTRVQGSVRFSRLAIYTELAQLPYRGSFHKILGQWCEGRFRIIVGPAIARELPDEPKRNIE